ncbi:alpha/beta hydrolase [Salininema proteolyticum]|uniref:Alpha/beta hydrolase n=1 Tax=Salininema proteolyticum TaxID=1607685 RepID=A0ABV8U0C9_9ACTN
MQTTFAFVHGSSSNSFTWTALQREMTLRGRHSLAVDLPGHGFTGSYPASYQAPQDLEALATAPSPLADVSFDDGVEHLASVLRRAKERGPVVLVAHSRGGIPVTGVLNAHPELVDHVVYIAAWCCVSSTPPEYAAREENRDSLLADVGGLLAADPAAIGAIRMNWRTGDEKLLATLKEAMLAEGTDDEFRVFLNSLEPDESLDFGGERCRADRRALDAVPHSYVRLTGDRSIPPALQDLFVAEADALAPDNPFTVHDLESSHVGFLVRPEGAADVLCGIGDSLRPDGG